MELLRSSLSGSAHAARSSTNRTSPRHGVGHQKGRHALKRLMRLLPGVMLVVVLAIAVAGVGVSAVQGRDQQATRRAPTAPPASSSADAVPSDATERQPVEPSAGATFEPSDGALMSTTVTAQQESPNATPRERRDSETMPSPDPVMAGPPVAYADPAGDAYGPAGNSALSQPAFDILHVEWAPASEAGEQQRGYSSSITVAGVARQDSGYVTYGDFPSDVPGERCQLYNILTPAMTAFANVFCGTTENGTRRFVGRLEGSEVTSTRTVAGGTVLSATFDDSALPAVLENGGRMLSKLSAFTCNGDPDGPAAGLGCGGYVIDEANTFNSYRV